MSTVWDKPPSPLLPPRSMDEWPETVNEIRDQRIRKFYCTSCGVGAKGRTKRPSCRLLNDEIALVDGKLYSDNTPFGFL